MTGGFCKIKSGSSMGFYSTIQQRRVLGNYAMIGAGNNASKDVFPFFIQVNNKYLRTNTHRIPIDYNITEYEHNLRILAEKVKYNVKDDTYNTDIYNLPIYLRTYITQFLQDRTF
jgi:hypothetical protein